MKGNLEVAFQKSMLQKAKRTTDGDIPGCQKSGKPTVLLHVYLLEFDLQLYTYFHAVSDQPFPRIFCTETLRKQNMDSPRGVKRIRRGGLRQRMNAADGEKFQESVFFVLLMQWYAEGVLSAVQCNELSKACVTDMEKAREGYKFPKLEALASVIHPKNTQRHIFNSIRREAGERLPCPLLTCMPFKGFTGTKSNAAILLPHEMFASFWENKQGWQVSVLPDESKLMEFWKVYSQNPSMQGHPVFKRHGFGSKCIPLMVHGDEVPVQGVGKIWSKSALLFSWASMIATSCGSSVEDTMIHIWGVFEQHVMPTVGGTAGTMSHFWPVLRWSFTAIWHGKWPNADWRGVK